MSAKLIEDEAQNLAAPPAETGNDALSAEWEYVETKCSAYVQAGRFKVSLNWNGGAENTELRAMCRLIAAAPDLYEALRAIEAAHYSIKGEAKQDPNKYCAVCVTLHTGRSAVYPCKAVKIARAALAKAEGK